MDQAAKASARRCTAPVPACRATCRAHAGSTFDAIVIGAGAAGCTAPAWPGSAGCASCCIDHADKVAEKIRISGGGRCNFTNRDTSPANFLSANPAFCRSALARYTPADFLALLKRHASAGTRSTRGSCSATTAAKTSSRCCCASATAGAVTRWQPCAVRAVRRRADGLRARHRPGQRGDRPTSSSRPAACRSRRSAPAISVIAWHASSDIALVDAAPRPGSADLRRCAVGTVCGAGRPVARSPGRHRRRPRARAVRRGSAVHPPRSERAGDPADLELLASRRRRSPSTWRPGSTSPARCWRPRRVRVESLPTNWRRCCRSGWPTPGSPSTRAGPTGRWRRCATATCCNLPRHSSAGI